MTLLNQQHQADIDGITPMPVDRVDDTSVINTSSAETATWMYNNAGVWASATGQAAATICTSKLTYTGVLNSIGSAVGSKLDTSLSFAAATRAETLVVIPESAFSKMVKMSVADKVAYVATWLTTNGYYAIDHRRGQIWLKSKAVVADDSVTYKYATGVSGGGTGDKVDIIKIGGVAVKLEDGTHANGDAGMVQLQRRADTPTTSASADGKYGVGNQDANGLTWVHEYYAPGYEDNVAGVAKVEQRYSTSGALTSDTQVKASAGFVHTVTISQNDAAPTAGTIDIYDNTAASGTKIFTWTLTTAVFTPFTVHLDVSCANGIYVDFTTTADVAVFVSYR